MALQQPDVAQSVESERLEADKLAAEHRNEQLQSDVTELQTSKKQVRVYTPSTLLLLAVLIVPC